MMNIYELLKDGMTAEEIKEAFDVAMSNAQVQYEKYLEEQKRIEREKAAKELERAYKKSHLEECRNALGAAIIDYFSALDIEVNDKMYETVDWIIDVLPHIKVVKTGGRFW